MRKRVNTSIIGYFASALLCCLMLFDTQTGMAQQEAMNAQFILNTMVINPGYTGYNQVQTITADHRSQWVGFKGAPTTNSLGFDMALPKNEELSIGGNLMHDKIGPTSEMTLSGTVAYRFKTSSRSEMSIGVKTSAGLFQANYTDLDLTSEYFGQEDINFSYNPSNVFLLNFGIGAYYHSETYFLGLSSPRLLKNTIDNSDFNTYNTIRGRTEPTYYLMGGYSFLLSAWTEFQPSFIVRATIGAPISMGGYGTFVLKDKWKIGGFYAYREMAGGLIQLQISDRILAGYSFDFSTNDLVSTNLGSHELAMTYQFRAFRKRLVFPRRF